MTPQQLLWRPTNSILTSGACQIQLGNTSEMLVVGPHPKSAKTQGATRNAVFFCVFFPQSSHVTASLADSCSPGILVLQPGRTLASAGSFPPNVVALSGAPTAL